MVGYDLGSAHSRVPDLLSAAPAKKLGGAETVDLFGFLTEVKPIDPKAMPIILTTAEAEMRRSVGEITEDE